MPCHFAGRTERVHETGVNPHWLQALALAPRQTFSLEWDKVRKEIADEKAGILPPPLVPKMPLVVTLGKKRKPAAKGKGALPSHAHEGPCERPWCLQWLGVDGGGNQTSMNESSPKLFGTTHRPTKFGHFVQPHLADNYLCCGGSAVAGETMSSGVIAYAKRKVIHRAAPVPVA